MTMRAIHTLILAAALSVASLPALAADAPPKHDPRQAFKESDTNGDGVVDHAEYQARIVEVFYFADVNKDGYLDEGELLILAFPEDFKAQDRDANGRVSLREFLRVRFADFPNVDTDGDGVLEVEEVVSAYEGKGK
jgi:Ca2+-binding EF-hand superfamily protein